MSSPMVSVIIPVYNDPEGVRMTLESVTNQTYPTDQYEIIVADNDSTDGTRDIVQSYVDRYPELVTLVIEDEIQSPAAARNHGIKRASGSVLVFIDSDMTADVDWLESVVDTLESGDHDYLGYTVDVYSWGSQTVGSEYDRLFSFSTAENLHKSDYAGTGCLAVRQAVFDDVGNFDAQLISSEDEEFGARVHAKGYDQAFDSSIAVYHPVRSSVVAQLRRHIRLGRGHRQLHNYYPSRFDAPNPLSLRQWLPLHPIRFHRDLTNRDKTISRCMAVRLWGLGSFAKLARSAGELLEWMSAQLNNR